MRHANCAQKCAQLTYNYTYKGPAKFNSCIISADGALDPTFIHINSLILL